MSPQCVVFAEAQPELTIVRRGGGRNKTKPDGFVGLFSYGNHAGRYGGDYFMNIIFLVALNIGLFSPGFTASMR
jgi:hypothetical protein